MKSTSALFSMLLSALFILSVFSTSLSNSLLLPLNHPQKTSFSSSASGLKSSLSVLPAPSLSQSMSLTSSSSSSIPPPPPPPDECHWYGSADDDDITLLCKLHTINSELENTNFSVIQSKNTIRLRLQCNDSLFFQSSIAPGSFRRLHELRSLSIEYCKIGNLTDGVFSGLKELRNLTIQTYNIDWSAINLEIGRMVFTRELDKLQYLDLSKNNIWLIGNEILCPLAALKYLNLSHNYIHDLSTFHFSASISTHLTKKCSINLLQLDLSHNQLDNLPPAIFSGLEKLEKLYLNNNKMNFIADRALEGLLSLKIVSFASNQLTNLPPELFNEAKNVQEIYLQNNQLNVLAPDLFLNLKQLLILDLSENDLTAEWITSVTFKGLTNLVLLNLSQNKIKKLEPQIFWDLENLQILKLNDNLIEDLSEQTFVQLKQVHTIILSNNQIKRLQKSVFLNLNNLKLLSIDYNQINEVHRNTILNCTQLEDLHLNGNKLVRVPDTLLNIIQQLKTLDLGEQHIQQIDNVSFTQMQNLYGLRLTENNIEFIKCGVFDKMIGIHILNLSHNKIHYIESGAFDYNKNLQAIRLDGNYLREINGLFTKLPNLVWLNISDNQLELFDYALIPTGLTWLDIHNNKIEELGNYFEIESQLALSTFDASSNRLKEITGSSIPNSIELLYLNDNLITKVQSYTFFKKPNLTRVDLFGNKITTLDPNSLRISIVQPDKIIPEFYIGGNPYQCDCNLDWLQKQQQQQQQQIDAQQSGSTLSPSFGGLLSTSASLSLSLSSTTAGSTSSTIAPGITRTQPKLMDIDSIYCKLLYNRGKLYVPLVESNSQQFLCKYEQHCFALCHCCDYFACDCKMECPAGCKCYHDQSWQSNVVDCSSANYYEKLPEQIPMDSTQLYLDGNHFPELNSHSFIGRKKLKILFLNNSMIDIIHNRTFNGLLDLEILQLNTNRLIKLEGNEFIGLPNLTELLLHNNKLQSIDKATFIELQNLKILTLHNNLLIDINYLMILPASAASSSSSSTTNHHQSSELILINPKLNEIKLANNSWTCNCQFLEKFYKFLSIASQFVKDKLKLKCLLELNKMNKSVNAMTPTTTTTTTTPRTTVIRTTSTSNMNLLKEIDNLFDIDDGGDSINNDSDMMMVNDDLLTTTQLQNRKNYVYVNILDNKNNISKLCILNNMNDLSSTNGILIGENNMQMKNLSNLLAAGAAGISQSSSTNFSPTSINNSSSSSGSGSSKTKTILTTQPIQNYWPLLIATLCSFFLIIIITLLIFIFRQEIRVWFHSHFGIRLFYRINDLDKNERDKLFDAFISYSSKDEQFVVDDLAPLLENGEPQYKLCLHYRDFPIGAYIADTILQAVESSRRTIMILSENFLKSEWCRFEFKSAHHQVLRDRRRRLIVILLGEVPQKDLDPDIRLYLKTNTYLQWGDKLFWEKLRFALPDVPQLPQISQQHGHIHNPHHHHHHHYHLQQLQQLNHSHAHPPTSHLPAHHQHQQIQHPTSQLAHHQQIPQQQQQQQQPPPQHIMSRPNMPLPTSVSNTPITTTTTSSSSTTTQHSSLLSTSSSSNSSIPGSIPPPPLPPIPIQQMVMAQNQHLQQALHPQPLPPPPPLSTTSLSSTSSSSQILRPQNNSQHLNSNTNNNSRHNFHNRNNNNTNNNNNSNNNNNNNNQNLVLSQQPLQPQQQPGNNSSTARTVAIHI